jgi:hypothetical protein
VRCGKNPELIDEPNRRDRFELLDTYVDESHLFRDLLKREECGQLYCFEFYEEIDWEDGNDPQYSTYIPVETGAEIQILRKASPLKLLEPPPAVAPGFSEGCKIPKDVLG